MLTLQQMGQNSYEGNGGVHEEWVKLTKNIKDWKLNKNWNMENTEGGYFSLFLRLSFT